MTQLLPEHTAYAEFTTSEAPDSLPTVAAYKVSADGVFGTQGGMSPTVVNVSGLSYYASAIVPEDAVPGDRFSLLVTVTVGGDSSVFWLALGQVERGLMTDEVLGQIDTIYSRVLTIGTGWQVRYQPLSTDGNSITIIERDSYTEPVDRQIEWTFPAEQFGDWTGATALWNFFIPGSDVQPLPISVTIEDAGLETQRLILSLSTIDTDVPANTYEWQLLVITSNQERVTVKSGCLRVLPSYV